MLRYRADLSVTVETVTVDTAALKTTPFVLNFLVQVEGNHAADLILPASIKFCLGALWYQTRFSIHCKGVLHPILRLQVSILLPEHGAFRRAWIPVSVGLRPSLLLELMGDVSAPTRLFRLPVV